MSPVTLTRREIRTGRTGRPAGVAAGRAGSGRVRRAGSVRPVAGQQLPQPRRAEGLGDRLDQPGRLDQTESLGPRRSAAPPRRSPATPWSARPGRGPRLVTVSSSTRSRAGPVQLTTGGGIGIGRCLDGGQDDVRTARPGLFPLRSTPNRGHDPETTAGIRPIGVLTRLYKLFRKRSPHSPENSPENQSHTGIPV